jgi:hypothetical protein
MRVIRGSRPSEGFWPDLQAGTTAAELCNGEVPQHTAANEQTRPRLGTSQPGEQGLNQALHVRS